MLLQRRDGTLKMELRQLPTSGLQTSVGPTSALNPVLLNIDQAESDVTSFSALNQAEHKSGKTLLIHECTWKPDRPRIGETEHFNQAETVY